MHCLTEILYRGIDSPGLQTTKPVVAEPVYTLW